MTNEQLQEANKISAEIKLIDEMEAEIEKFKKQRFSGSLPLSVSKFIASDCDVALKVVSNVWDMAMIRRVELATKLEKL
jgi:hypothetical protein